MTETKKFLRALYREKTPLDDWKNVLKDSDPFQSPAPSPEKRESRWVKFAISLSAPDRVVFQDSSKYAFHYDFAVQRLPEFAGYTRAQFDAATLRTNSQRAVLGAVLFPPTTNIVEAGIQFVGADAYPREAIASWFEAVRARLALPPNAQVFYLPTFEQRTVAQENAAWFAQRGISVSSIDRWVIADEIYSAGWALGRLVFVPANEIAEAYRAGRLRPSDILATDVVPAEVPPLAGIVTLSPATPNSHVALLAKSFGIPFVHVARDGFENEIKGWSGRDVMLRAVEAYAERHAVVWPVAMSISEAMRGEIAQLKTPPRLNFKEKAAIGAISVPVDGLGPDAIRFVGGKAANFGVLRRSAPTNSPAPAIGFTFDLWDAYLDQTLPNNRTLRAEISERLSGFAWPPDMAALQTALAGIRDLIEDTADFSVAQRSAILAVLREAGFDPSRKIRFRSSTNVEDSEQFSGAGLYESFSGCLADDLDADASGPSQCEPEEPKERGVFRALRKVYASFYKDNAFLERLRHGVDESKAGMGVLVHYSTPDVFELANGVATLELRHHAGGTWEMRTRLVSQLGAVSVTNPDTIARPEEVDAVDFSSGGLPYFSVRTRSSLVPLGDTVLQWRDEYLALYRVLKAAAQRWQQEAGTNQVVTFDFEYKKEEPGRLSVKQIRIVPPAVVPPPAPPYLISTTNRYAIYQGEYTDIIANHRLKSMWGLTTRNLRWLDSNLTSSVLATVDARFFNFTNAVQFSGPIAALPEHTFAREEGFTADRWAIGTGLDRREFEFRIYDTDFRFNRLGPLTGLEDYKIRFSVAYPAAQPGIAEDTFAVTNSFKDEVWIVPLMALKPDSKRQDRTLRYRRSIEIDTSYYWPEEPRETGGGYTAPLLAWAGTTIRGLTGTPITLQGEFSQTYRPGHHNSFEDFVFDPWLEPELDPNLLEQLARDNIRAIIVRRGQPITPLSPTGSLGVDAIEDIFVIWGLDGQFRPLQ